MTDAQGSPLQVVRIPSPGLVHNDDGDVVPASHMNFIIANEAVIVPLYTEETAGFAIEALQSGVPRA
jgi:agmatine deiminase